MATSAGGLQNSKSPFKAKHSKKMQRSSLTEHKKAGDAGPNTVPSTQNSPVVVIKKKHSSKNSIRKQSANNVGLY